MKRIIIKNGIVCLENKITKCDLLIENDKISTIGKIAAAGASIDVIDAEGSYVLPGLFDIHTHLDDQIGDFYLADTYESGTKIALQNGITTVYNFITQSPKETLAQAIQKAKEKATGKIYCHLGWHITPTKFDEQTWKEIIELILQGFRTFKFYTTYKEAGLYCSYEQLSEIAEKLKDNDVTVLVHCEDDDILKLIDHSQYDLNNPYFYSLLRPPKAEVTAIKNIIQIAKETGVAFHIVHVSTQHGVDLIQQNKIDAKITCETCPQFLFLNNKKLSTTQGFYYLCSPPLRYETIRAQLYERARENCIDVYATDHCAFHREHKEQHQTNFLKTPKGIAGLGALVPMIYELYKARGRDGIFQMAQKLSTNPAKVVGLYPKKGVIRKEADADLVIIKDKNMTRPIISSLGKTYEPYQQFLTTLEIDTVLLNGKIVVQRNHLIAPQKPTGLLCQQ